MLPRAESLSLHKKTFRLRRKGLTGRCMSTECAFEGCTQSLVPSILLCILFSVPHCPDVCLTKVLASTEPRTLNQKVQSYELKKRKKKKNQSLLLTLLVGYLGTATQSLISTISMSIFSTHLLYAYF